MYDESMCHKCAMKALIAMLQWSVHKLRNVASNILITALGFLKYIKFWNSRYVIHEYRRCVDHFGHTSSLTRAAYFFGMANPASIKYARERVDFPPRTDSVGRWLSISGLLQASQPVRSQAQEESVVKYTDYGLIIHWRMGEMCVISTASCPLEIWCVCDVFSVCALNGWMNWGVFLELWWGG